MQINYLIRQKYWTKVTDKQCKIVHRNCHIFLKNNVTNFNNIVSINIIRMAKNILILKTLKYKKQKNISNYCIIQSRFLNHKIYFEGI